MNLLLTLHSLLLTTCSNLSNQPTAHFINDLRSLLWIVFMYRVAWTLICKFISLLQEVPELVLIFHNNTHISNRKINAPKLMHLYKKKNPSKITQDTWIYKVNKTYTVRLVLNVLYLKYVMRHKTCYNGIHVEKPSKN